MSHRCAERVAALLAASQCLALCACSNLKPWQNDALQAGEVVQYDGRAQLFDVARVPDVLVVASFSGGGSRAAAFAHAVVGELDALPFVWRGRPTTLAREIDMVIGVSGGSIAAAHLAWHGVAGHLERFDEDFLSRDFQSHLVRRMLAPSGLRDVTSPWVGRGNILADRLEAVLFPGATFGRLGELEARPYLIVGATDLSTGAEFDFTSEQFAILCSSIDDVPLSFAVAASSAVPLLFSPLTVQIHRDGCGVAQEVLQASAASAGDSARVKLTKGELDALATGERQFIHLVDGGLSDNLGTRRITDYVAQSGGIGAVLHALRQSNSESDPLPQHIVFIAINSERQGPLPIDQRGEVPTMREVADAIINGGLGRMSRETGLVFNEAVEQWRTELDTLGADGRDTDIFAIEINLSDVGDAALRKRVLEVPTAFRVSPEDLAVLRQVAQLAVAGSDELQRFLASVAR
jgi:NTE family protein